MRREVEAVEPAALGRFSVAWHGIGVRRGGPDALLDVIEQLQGAALPASILEHDILGARLRTYSPDWLDALAAAGEIVWVGVEPLGQRDGRVALYLTDQIDTLLPPPARAKSKGSTDASRRSCRFSSGTARRSSIRCTRPPAAAIPGDTVDALWRLVWRGVVTSDTFFALRAFARPRESKRDARCRRRRSGRGARSRERPKAAGRSSVMPAEPPR